MASATDPSGTGDLAVYHDRIGRLQAEMDRTGIDVTLVGPSSDFFYLTGHDAHLSERMTLLLVPRSGPVSVVVPVLEAPLVMARRELFDISAWSETERPWERAAQLLELTDGGSETTIAVSDQLWSIFLLNLQGQLPKARWVSATPTMRPLRMHKDVRERELLREVSRMTDEAWEAFIANEKIAGLTEKQAVALLRDRTAAAGVTMSAHGGICASGPNSASPHHHTSDRVIQPGDAVIFDWGGTLGGYHSDVTRTVHVGEPSEEFRTVYETVKRANQAAFEAVRPGVACQDIDRAARDLITQAGYGDAFIHRVGHGLGLDIHEEPYMVSGNELPLAPGMVFSDEPGIYLEGRFGVRIEDTVICVEDGGDRINHATRDLVVMG
jgi:Xaa-Pro aminopeptidase